MGNLGINLGVLVGGIGAPIQYPFINGFRPSWASIEFAFAFSGGTASAPNFALQSIDYGITRERKKTRGTNVDPLGKTRGMIDYKCKIKMLLAEWNVLINQLGQQDPTGNFAYGDIFFQLTVQYAEPNTNLITDVIQGCTLDSSEQSSSEGADDIVVESELSPLKILRNGQPMSSQPLGAPNF
jgi:hypothetical protein